MPASIAARIALDEAQRPGQVVERGEARRGRLAHLEEVAQVAPRLPGAHPAGAALVERAVVAGAAGVAEVQPSRRR